jgi:hypothetical protein
MMFVMIFVAALGFGQDSKDVRPGVPVLPSDSTVLTDILNAPPVMPVGPEQLLQDYERQMTAISRQLEGALSEVLDGVQSGELDPDAADYISVQSYHAAMMRYELLSVLHADLAKKIADAAEQADADAEDQHAFDPSPSAAAALRRARAPSVQIRATMPNNRRGD